MSIVLASANAQFARLNVRTLGLRQANDTLAIGGMFKYSLPYHTSPMVASFGNSTVTEIRCMHDINNSKVYASHQSGGSGYHERGFIPRTRESFLDVWTNFLVVVGADRFVRLYLDGVLAPSLSGTTAPPANATLGQFLTFGGRSPATATTYLTGKMAELYHYAGTIPGDQEIEYLTKRGRPDLVPGIKPTYYWPMKEDANQVLGTQPLALNGTVLPTFDAADHPLMNDGSWSRIATWW